MRLRLIRHATLLLKVAGRRILVDPMLDPAGARPAVANTPNPHPNPLCELPEPGFVLAPAGEPALYVAGDTIWCDEVRDALDEHRPGAVVVNAGAARFLEGDPIVMTADDVVAVARHAPGTRVVAVHMEAIDHCLLTRADLHQRLHEERLHDHVTVPEDGAEVPLP